MSEETKRGKFIVLEGLDGAGKSEQAKDLAAYVEECYGVECLSTHEPGGGPIGAELRKILLDAKGVEPLTELLLFGAGRNEHVKKVITPALDEGAWVICERYVGSSHAYQGGGRGTDQEIIKFLMTHVIGEETPDLTLFLDIPVEVIAERVAKRGGAVDRFEGEGAKFFENVRDAYKCLDMFKSWEVIDATPDYEEVRQNVRRVVDEYFGDQKV